MIKAVNISTPIYRYGTKFKLDQLNLGIISHGNNCSSALWTLQATQLSYINQPYIYEIPQKIVVIATWVKKLTRPVQSFYSRYTLITRSSEVPTAASPAMLWGSFLKGAISILNRCVLLGMAYICTKFYKFNAYL